MKKILFVVLAIMLVATSSFALTVKDTVNNFSAGASTTDHESVTMQVYNYTDGTLSNGDVVTWDLTSDDGRSVTKVNRLGQKVAGVITETITASSWGTMLVYGYHAAVKIAGASNIVTTGYGLYAWGSSDSVVTTNTDNTNDGKACGGYGISCANGDKPLATSYTRHTIPNAFGTALDTTTTGTTVEAFIDCL